MGNRQQVAVWICHIFTSFRRACAKRDEVGMAAVTRAAMPNPSLLIGFIRWHCGPVSDWLARARLLVAHRLN
jgi:hypothetical protein